jgi:hypothetical protein
MRYAIAVATRRLSSGVRLAYLPAAKLKVGCRFRPAEDRG